MLSFTLSRLQRMANPPERLLYVCLAVGQVMLGLWVVVMSPVVGSILLLMISLLVGLIFRGPIYSFFASALTRGYVNTVEMDHAWVKFGIDGLQAVLPGKSALKVSKGLFGTFIIRNLTSGHSWIIPQNAITLSGLRNVTAGHDLSDA